VRWRRLPQRRCSYDSRQPTERNTREPMLSIRLSGSLLLRAAGRAMPALTSHDPPRTTRATPKGTPQNCTLPGKYAPDTTAKRKVATAAARRSQ
jgi:hypothetical protein